MAKRFVHRICTRLDVHVFPDQRDLHSGRISGPLDAIAQSSISLAGRLCGEISRGSDRPARLRPVTTGTSIDVGNRCQSEMTARLSGGSRRTSDLVGISHDPDPRSIGTRSDVGLDPDLAQLVDRACWVGLVFSSSPPSDVRHKRQMDEQQLLAADVERELADRLEEWQALILPTVPPNSVITTSTSSVRQQADALSFRPVMCGTTCTVLPRYFAFVALSGLRANRCGRMCSSTRARFGLFVNRS